MLNHERRDIIFGDARVFDAAWVPSDFHSRDAELNSMATSLEPLLEEEPATGLFLYGPSGTGKTSSSRYLLGQLQQHLFGLEIAYVNCWSDHSRYGVLYRIADEVSELTPSKHERSSTALRDAIRSVDSPIVVLLDEADQLDEPEILYDLYEEPGLEIIITANNQEDVTLGLDDRIQSRLRTFTTVAFNSYSTDELVPILRQRVKHGLQPDVIDEEYLWDIARFSSGNARDAIAALKGSAQAAAEAESERIHANHIQSAIDGASHEVRRQTLQRLNDHQYTLYEIVASTSPISPGAIFEEYQEKMSDPLSKRTVRKYLRKLDEYDLVHAEGTSQKRKYTLASGAPTPD